MVVAGGGRGVTLRGTRRGSGSVIRKLQNDEPESDWGEGVIKKIRGERVGGGGQEARGKEARGDGGGGKVRDSPKKKSGSNARAVQPKGYYKQASYKRKGKVFRERKGNLTLFENQRKT